MTPGPGDLIYRAMTEDGGMPKIGTRATTLGIRVGVDIVPDPANLVHRPAFIPGEANGLSCAPTIHCLPPFALPVEWGGMNTRTAVWMIAREDLPPTLFAEEDTRLGGRRHISIGPAATMNCNDFVKAIAGTRASWRKVTPGGGGP